MTYQKLVAWYVKLMQSCENSLLPTVKAGLKILNEEYGPNEIEKYIKKIYNNLLLLTQHFQLTDKYYLQDLTLDFTPGQLCEQLMRDKSTYHQLVKELITFNPSEKKRIFVNEKTQVKEQPLLYLKCPEANDILLRNILTTIPISVIMLFLEDIFPDEEEQNQFKRRLFTYEINYGAQVYRAQERLSKLARTKEAVLEKWPSYRDFLNATKGKNEGDKLYSSFIASFQLTLDAWERKYQTHIVPRYVEKIVKNTAYDLLKHIQEVIFTTKWPVNMGGTKIYDDQGDYINTVPFYMVRMLNVIQTAYKKDNSGRHPIIWCEAYKEVNAIGIRAAHDKPFSFFGYLKGNRGKLTQDFYNGFEMAAQNQRKRRVLL